MTTRVYVVNFDYPLNQDWSNPFWWLGLPQIPVVAPLTVSKPASNTNPSVAASSTTTSTPADSTSWIAGLTNASIKADMVSAISDGTVSYSGLENLISDLDNSLKSSNKTLSSSQYSDLKTIAANLNNGISTSSYLTDAFTSLVDGSALNATWTGGSASSSALGNLGAGSSYTTLSELNGKWLLGTDLPSSKVSLSGEASFNVTYSTVSNPLYSASGPSINDINQGELGDCFLLASLAETAFQNQSAITSMIQSNGNGTYGVRFYVDGTAEWVTVNSQLADGGDEFNYSSGGIWASLVEKAYTQLQTGGSTTGNIYSGNTWSSIGNGGDVENALEQITGASSIIDYALSSKSSWESIKYNQSIVQVSSSSNLTSASVLSAFVSDLDYGYEVVLSSYTNAYDSSGKQTLVSDHAMSVYGYDSSTGLLEIRNPWGTESGQTWDTTFEVSLSTLLNADDTLSVATLTTTAIASASQTTSLAGYSSAQVAALTASQVGNLSATQLKTLSTSQFTDLNSAQIAAISATALTGLSTSDIAALTSAQAKGLLSSQMYNLTNTQVAALTAPALSILATSQLAGLSVAGIEALTTAQEAMMSTTSKAYVAKAFTTLASSSNYYSNETVGQVFSLVTAAV